MPNSIPRACYAPPINDTKLADYTALIAAMPASPVKDSLQKLLACVKAWFALPDSTRTDGATIDHIHNGQPITVKEVPFTQELIDQLWDVTPWMHELAGLSTTTDDGLFDLLSGPVRDCAFHLLWHVKEITLDREPITLDKLGV
jgi:hypothetical protein